MTKEHVLDASVVLAFLQDENGCDKIEKILTAGKAIISAVNYAEVVAKLFEAGMPEESVKKVMENLELHIEVFDQQQAWMTGMLRTSTRQFGLSLADRACLALAHTKQLPVYTADKQWARLEIAAEIIQLR